MGQPHKHAEFIKAWADGEDLECRHISPNGDATDWAPISKPHAPSWDATEYRIKPDPRAIRDMAIAVAVADAAAETWQRAIRAGHTVVDINLTAIIATVKD